ncbi:hypothetical protein McanCB56680_003294 [Microsporum canis]
MDDGVERDGPPGEAYDEQEFDREKGFDEQFCRTAYRSRECQDTKAVDSVVVSASHNLAKQVAAAIRSDIYGSQPPVWAPLGHPRLSYSLSHSVVTCGTGGPTHTAVYPLHDPTKLPAHHYEQYINLPPPTTDPYACRLTAPSKDGDGTNTPTALPFETSRARVVGPQGQRGDLPITNLPERTEILVTTDSRVQCPQCPKTFAHKKHVKRHLLRRKSRILDQSHFLLLLLLTESGMYTDTGERPYVCALCRDSFTRSDVLKRHFQKCSLRRGNPTGARHLSHPQARRPRVDQGRCRHEGGANTEAGGGVVESKSFRNYGSQ